MKAAVVPQLGAPLEMRDHVVDARRTRVVTAPRRLEDVNACFEELLDGRVPARLVFDMVGDQAQGQWPEWP